MKLTMDGECMYTPARSNIQLPVSNHRSSSASLYSSSSARNIMGPDSGARRAARLLDPRSLLKVKRKLFDLDNDSTTSSVELNNNNNNNNINNTSKTSVGITGSGVGSDFHQKMLEECEKKWNFDLVNCVPLDGRYEWVKMKPEEGPEFYRRSYVDLKRRVVDNSRENCPPKMADSGNYFKRQRRVTEDLSNGNNISCPFGKDITMLAELNGNNTCSIVINNNTTINNNSTVIDISNLKKERNNNFGDDDHSNNDFHDVAMGIKSITTTASSTNNNLTPDSITATTTSRIQYNNNSSSNCSHNENINNCRNFNPYYNINSKDMDSTTTTTTLSGDETIINTGTTLLLGSHGDVCINNNNNNNTINIDNENNNNNNVSITEKSNNCDNTITTISTFSSSSPSSSSSSPSSLPNLCYSSSSPISSPSSSPLSLTLSPNSTTTTTTLALTPSSSSSTTIHTIPTQKDRKLLVKQTKIVEFMQHKKRTLSCNGNKEDKLKKA